MKSRVRFLLALVFAAASGTQALAQTDPLPSWTEECRNIVIPGRGSAREPGKPGTRNKEINRLTVFMGSGPGPDGPSRNDMRVFQHPC
jgi:hypothetical protein